MTSRLYYTDSYVTEFDATVVTAEAHDGNMRVVLDTTAFYPTSGGQPHDLGTLGGSPVVDVIDEDDGRIVHVVRGSIVPGHSVHGHVDWTRRFDHMQQHTGQHVLSAAFDKLLGVRTMSFHLGAEMATIDLAREVSSSEIARVEIEANRVVWANEPVLVRFVTAEEAKTLAFRKEPAREGTLRIVEMPDFDLSACGGTHVARTGEVGIIAVAAAEKFKSGSRITFVCGGRALKSHGRLRDVVTSAMRQLSVASHEIQEAVERLQTEAKAGQKTIAKLQQELAAKRGDEMRGHAGTISGVKLVAHVEPGWDAPALKTLASAIVSAPGYVALVAGDGQPRPIVIARSADLSFDCGAWMKAATAAFGGRGGGRLELAQGGIPADADAIIEHLRGALNLNK